MPTHQQLANPHLSPSLKYLRRSVHALCWVVGVALVLQVLTWAFVNFTEMRFESIAAADQSAKVVVVPPKGEKKPQPRTLSLRNKSATGESTDAPVSHAEKPQEALGAALGEADPTSAVQTADVNRAMSHFDVWFKTQHQLALTAGIAAAIALAVQLFMGSIVAATANIAGIRKVLSAQGWSLILLALCFPWQRLAAEMPFPGIFSTYADMTAQSDLYLAQDAGASPALLFYGRYLILPAIAIAMTLLVGLRFGVGADSGIIPGGPTPEELAIEAEASNRKAGSLVGGGRVGGAFTTAVAPLPNDEDTVMAPAPPPPPPRMAPLTSPSAPAMAPPAQRPI